MKIILTILTLLTLANPASAEYDSLREKCGTDQVCYVAECNRLKGRMEGNNCYHD